VAALLVTLPLELVTTTLKVEPLSAVVVAGSGVTGSSSATDVGTVLQPLVGKRSGGRSQLRLNVAVCPAVTV